MFIEKKENINNKLQFIIRFIKRTSLYEYFIKYGQDPEFSNLLIGSGGSGGGYGLDNGIGFFGSIGIDRAFITVVP